MSYPFTEPNGGPYNPDSWWDWWYNPIWGAPPDFGGYGPFSGGGGSAGPVPPPPTETAPPPPAEQPPAQPPVEQLPPGEPPPDWTNIDVWGTGYPTGQDVFLPGAIGGAAAAAGLFPWLLGGGEAAPPAGQEGEWTDPNTGYNIRENVEEPAPAEDWPLSPYPQIYPAPQYGPYGPSPQPIPSELGGLEDIPPSWSVTGWGTPYPVQGGGAPGDFQWPTAPVIPPPGIPPNPFPQPTIPPYIPWDPGDGFGGTDPTIPPGGGVPPGGGLPGGFPPIPLPTGGGGAPMPSSNYPEVGGGKVQTQFPLMRFQPEMVPALAAFLGAYRGR